MKDFLLSSKAIYKILESKRIPFLYHANTIQTSLTFIKQRALLSRHYIEINDLLQSPQKSDEEDKKYDVWDHIFLDGADLHYKYSRANKYGPVLFKINTDILLSPLFTGVYVTKTNPWYWRPYTTIDNKFYSNVDQVSEDYLTGKRLDSQIMFTLRNPGANLKLNKFLYSIELDMPKLIIRLRDGNDKNIGLYAREKIEQTLNENGLGHIPIETRHQHGLTWCKCQIDYNFLNKEELRRRFRYES